MKYTSPSQFSPVSLFLKTLLLFGHGTIILRVRVTPLDQSVLYGVSRLTSTVARVFALSFLFGPFYFTIFSAKVLVWTHTEQIVHKFQVRVTTFSKHKLLLCLNRLAKNMF